MTLTALLLCLLIAAPCDACLPNFAADTPVPTAIKTPTPSPLPPPLEWDTVICASRHLVRDDSVLMAEYWDVLDCLGWDDPPSMWPLRSPANTCWSYDWMLTTHAADEKCARPEYLWQYLRSYTLPARDCPQAPGAWCCTNYANNWCDCSPGGPQQRWCDCDGIYLTDFGSGPGPRRVAGTMVFCPSGPVIVAAEPNANCGNTAWRHELIHLLRWWTGDPVWGVNDDFEGWVCQ